MIFRLIIISKLKSTLFLKLFNFFQIFNISSLWYNQYKKKNWLLFLPVYLNLQIIISNDINILHLII